MAARPRIRAGGGSCGGTTADLVALTFVSDDVAAAIGEDVVLRSVDRGATGAPVETPMVADELIVDTHDCLVVTGAEGTVCVAWGTWHAVEGVEPANTFYALSPGGRWLVGRTVRSA